jgi:septum formation protein
VPLILASSSAIRQSMLNAAGVPHAAQAAAIDETELKITLTGASETSLELAKAKAVDVSRREPEAWVIGSDSVISVDGRLYDKPRDRGQAAEHLRAFSGRSMELTSAAALARGGAIDWAHCETAILHVRNLSDSFIEAYLETEWPEVSYCVGVFRLEGPGVQLFDGIEGDYFTILGMPLLPLLGALRDRRIIER